MVNWRNKELNSLLSHLIEQLWASSLMHSLLNLLTNGVHFPLPLHPISTCARHSRSCLLLCSSAFSSLRRSLEQKKSEFLMTVFLSCPWLIFSKCDSNGCPDSRANWKLISRIFFKCQYLFEEISCLGRRGLFFTVIGSMMWYSHL